MNLLSVAVGQSVQLAAHKVLDALNALSDPQGQLSCIPAGPERDALQNAYSELYVSLAPPRAAPRLAGLVGGPPGIAGFARAAQDAERKLKEADQRDRAVKAKLLGPWTADAVLPGCEFRQQGQKAAAGQAIGYAPCACGPLAGCSAPCERNARAQGVLR